MTRYACFCEIFWKIHTALINYLKSSIIGTKFLCANPSYPLLMLCTKGVYFVACIQRPSAAFDGRAYFPNRQFIDSEQKTIYES